ncbi:MAG: stalk domain-containing protein [Defluviitaleaceae bacterium]|nr:stalk domain-containing protein [Defluviitaleaceae bacterium]
MLKKCIGQRKLHVWITIAAMLCILMLLGAFNRPSTYDSKASGRTTLSGRIAAWSDDMIKHEKIDTREEGLEMEGYIPVLTAYAGLLQSRINAEISRIIADKVSDAREMRSRTLAFAYDAYFSAPYMSIILKSTTTSGSSKTEVVSINFNISTGELLNAADVVGPHVVQLADRLLVEMIRRNPEHYNPGFTGMRSNQAFSITDDEIIFWFDEFQLAPGYEGVVSLALHLDDIKAVCLPWDQIHIRENFNLKMVPIGVILEDLGYTIIWNCETKIARIYHGDEFIIELNPEINNYVRDQRFVRSLEAPPEIRNGYYLYVPISFFDQILNLVAYSIEDQERITFVSYPVTDDWFDR